MSFPDCFREFHEIAIDEHLRLRRHHPRQYAEAFFRIYSDRDAFRYCYRETCPGGRFTDAFVKALDSRINMKSQSRSGQYDALAVMFFRGGAPSPLLRARGKNRTRV